MTATEPTWAPGSVDPESHLTWLRTTVDGRAAGYGVGGPDGPVVVFLHGWALGSRAYRRAIKRLIVRGCRVYTPALPSFGGTAPLSHSQMNMAGYAEWVASFMQSVGIDAPAMLIGHSFGGGVAIKLAQLHPELVRYLVLLNAVGGLVPRAPWDWLAGFTRELWPPSVVLETADAVRADVIPNLIRNPLGLVRAAFLASTADLSSASADVRARGIPVLALTSDGDGVIPKAAFEALCDAVGTDGRVVSGRHSWILADPDSFSSAVGPLIDVQVTEHRQRRAATRGEEIASLLKSTHAPRRVARALVRNADPLWLMSESAAVLATDLALCHPRLRRGEIRAVARPIEDSRSVRLAIVTEDRRGLFADTAAVLASNGLSITNASATTWPGRNLALHAYVIEDGEALDRAAWTKLGEELRAMASAEVATAVLPDVHPLQVTVHGIGGDQLMVTIDVPDEIGVLAGLCRALSDGGINIESLNAQTSSGMARDTFLVSGKADAEVIAKLFDDAGPTSVTGAGRVAIRGLPLPFDTVVARATGWCSEARALVRRVTPWP